MTRPLSSLANTGPGKPRLVDSSGAEARLGELIGSGGEGQVFHIEGAPGVAAKLYHKPPVEEHAAKLKVMTKVSADDLGAISAWPRGLLFDPSTKQLRGVMMPLVAEARELHELYGTTGRERHFPHAQWGHLILAARNIAAAFDTLHRRGVIVGDVNQGNLLVDREMQVRFIDCDSFQLRGGGRVFRCPVGTPHFTPPELQAVRLSEISRTNDHDNFGLAILIFHLMFVGRHPFAGRFLGEGDLTIERAIAERRFAFSRNTDQTQVEPPPATLRLEDLPPKIGEMFEQAFRQQDDGPPRPAPSAWVAELEKLLRQRKQCQLEEAHAYYGGSLGCPWCRIEDAGGPTFFLNIDIRDGSTEARLAALDKRIDKIDAINFPSLPPRALRIPTLPLMRERDDRPKPTLPDRLAQGLVGAGVLSVAGAFYWPVLAAGAVASAGIGGALLLAKPSSARRQELDDYDARLRERLLALADRSEAVERFYLAQRKDYDGYAAVVSTGLQRYEADTESLQTIMGQLRQEQKDDFLRDFLIRDYRRRIKGLEPAMVSLLESYGVESALEIDKHLLAGIPLIDEELQLQMLAWRQKMEEKFEYKPEPGLNEREMQANRQEATRRFKISQARKVLDGAKRLRAMAHEAKHRIDKQVDGFKHQANDWREMARERQEFQAARTPLERKINASPLIVAAAAAAGPLIGLIGLWMLG